MITSYQDLINLKVGQNISIFLLTIEFFDIFSRQNKISAYNKWEILLKTEQNMEKCMAKSNFQRIVE